MIVGIGIHLEGVISVVGTGIVVEILTMDQIRPLAQMRRTEVMEVAMVAAVAMATLEAATMAMDSPTSTKQEPLEARTTSRLSSLLLKLSHRMV